MFFLLNFFNKHHHLYYNKSHKFNLQYGRQLFDPDFEDRGGHLLYHGERKGRGFEGGGRLLALSWGGGLHDLILLNIVQPTGKN